MKRCFNSIISVFCCLAIVVSFSIVPAHAEGGVVDSAVGVVKDFVEWSVKGEQDMVNGFWRYIFGDDFNTATNEELKAAYDTYVSTLPADNINSQGLSNFYITGWTYSPSTSAYNLVSSLSDYPCFDGYCTADKPGTVTTKTGTAIFDAASGKFSVPVTGTYAIVFPASELSSIYFPDTYYACRLYGGTYSSYLLGKIHTGFSVTLTLVAGEEYYITSKLASQNADKTPNGIASFRCYRPYISGVRLVSSGSDTYNTTTRPTSITGGNYGIVGDNGQITKVEDNSTIVNETNNTFYNPATGTTVPITNWSYDYSDRSYKLTLDGDTTTTVTYGDENITIKEGDTVYNIYYLVDGSGSETPVDPPVDPPGPCEHTWAETSSTPATCTTSGSKLSTCSKCQQTKTEPIPALGHDWQIKKSVTTQYDDTGQLVQKGYTIYECSRCYEQYKSEDGTGPPDTSPEDPGEEEEKKGFFSWLWGILSETLKKLIEGVVDAILKTLDFFFGGDSQSNYDFYNSPSTFSGVSVWAS